MCMYVHPSAGALPQARGVGSPRAELQVVVSPPFWVQRLSLGSSGREKKNPPIWLSHLWSFRVGFCKGSFVFPKFEHVYASETRKQESISRLWWWAPSPRDPLAGPHRVPVKEGCNQSWASRVGNVYRTLPLFLGNGREISSEKTKLQEYSDVAFRIGWWEKVRY